MADLYENIQHLCAEKDIRPGRLCDELGISRGLMTAVELKSLFEEYFNVDTVISDSKMYQVSGILRQ